MFTPCCDLGSLEGITQEVVVTIAEKRGIMTTYKKMLPHEIYDADECFLTGTAAEIIPVIDVSGKKIGNGKPGEITKQLLKDFRELTKTDGENY